MFKSIKFHNYLTQKYTNLYEFTLKEISSVIKTSCVKRFPLLPQTLFKIHNYVIHKHKNEKSMALVMFVHKRRIWV